MSDARTRGGIVNDVGRPSRARATYSIGTVRLIPETMDHEYEPAGGPFADQESAIEAERPGCAPGRGLVLCRHEPPLRPRAVRYWHRSLGEWRPLIPELPVDAVASADAVPDDTP